MTTAAVRVPDHSFLTLKGQFGVFEVRSLKNGFKTLKCEKSLVKKGIVE